MIESETVCSGRAYLSIFRTAIDVFKVGRTNIPKYY